VGDELVLDVRNDNFAPVALLSSDMTWTSLDPAMYANVTTYQFFPYWFGPDYESPTSATTNRPHAGGTTVTWNTDFNNIPGNLLAGDLSVTLTYSGGCVVDDSISAPTPTPTS
jgi:hypothetical protein